MKRKAISLLTAGLLAVLTGCTQAAGYEGFEKPQQPASTLVPAADTYRTDVTAYEDAGIPDKCLDTVSSGDGACVIRKMEHYYDVTLDYQHHSAAAVGSAYAEASIRAFPDYHAIVEPYVYENIMMAFPALTDDYTPVEERITYLSHTLRPDQQEELFGFAETLSGGTHGFAEDGHISYEEAVTFNLIVEALRGTACSALSLWGEKTENGDMIASRFLDWNLGSEYQMCRLHAVIHANKGERSYTGITFLGFNGIVSAINDDGVFAAILDVGSHDTKYTYQNRKCYTYELRYALEEYGTAREIGEFMVENSASFTYSHHIYLADGKETFCAEDAVAELQKSGKGYSVLRDSQTPLLDAIHWDQPDSLCVVNSFAAEGNQDSFTGNSNNFVRFYKYNEWVGAEDKFTIGELKTALTCEQVNLGVREDEPTVDNVRWRGTSQIILVDYHTGKMQVSFTSPEGPSDDVIFTDIGHF